MSTPIKELAFEGGGNYSFIPVGASENEFGGIKAKSVDDAFGEEIGITSDGKALAPHDQTKLDVLQGLVNSGRFLRVNNEGNIEPAEEEIVSGHEYIEDSKTIYFRDKARKIAWSDLEVIDLKPYATFPNPDRIGWLANSANTNNDTCIYIKGLGIVVLNIALQNVSEDPITVTASENLMVFENLPFNCGQKNSTGTALALRSNEIIGRSYVRRGRNYIQVVATGLSNIKANTEININIIFATYQ